MVRVPIFLISCLSLLIVSGCSVLKRQASEGDTQVAVAFEGWSETELPALVRRALERPLTTPQDEKRFYTTFVDEDSLGPVSRWQQVLLLGSLDSDDRISQRIQRMLSGDVLEGVREGRYSLFRQGDVWARGQTVIVIVAPTRSELIEQVRTQSAEIYALFSEARDARMEHELYSVYEQKTLADSLRKAHGWRLRIPHDYTLVASSSDPGYVRLRRFYPDRFITIAWREGTIDQVEVEEFLAWKDSLGTRFADPQRVNRSVLDSKTISFRGREALQVHGLWETRGAAGGGGPFVSYLLHHLGTLYLLDGQVYAPDRAKEMFVRQLEVILRTFEP